MGFCADFFCIIFFVKSDGRPAGRLPAGFSIRETMLTSKKDSLNVIHPHVLLSLITIKNTPACSNRDATDAYKNILNSFFSSVTDTIYKFLNPMGGDKISCHMTAFFKSSSDRLASDKLTASAGSDIGLFIIREGFFFLKSTLSQSIYSELKAHAVHIPERKPRKTAAPPHASDAPGPAGE